MGVGGGEVGLVMEGGRGEEKEKEREREREMKREGVFVWEKMRMETRDGELGM